MKNKYISYILLVFIVFLGFGTSVEADVPELTCIYEGSPFSDAVMFVQYNNRIELWRHPGEDNPSADSNGWVIYNNASFYSDSQFYGYQNNKAFSDCPALADYGDSRFYFYDDENSMYHDLFWGWGAHHKLIDKVEGAVDVPEVDINSFGDSDSNVEFNYSSTDGVDCSSFNDNFNWLVDRDTDTYNMSCLYTSDVLDKCVIIQLDYNNSDLRISNSYLDSSYFEYDFGTPDILESYGSEMCPINLYYSYKNSVGFVATISGLKISLTDSASVGRFSLVKSTNGVDDVEIQFQTIEIGSCTDLVGEEIASYLKFAFTALKIAIPLILIGLGVVDFARGVFSGEDEMKKIQQKFIKRIILGIAIFLVPTVLSLLFDIVETIFDISIDTCGLF